MELDAWTDAPGAPVPSPARYTFHGWGRSLIAWRRVLMFCLRRLAALFGLGAGVFFAATPHASAQLLPRFGGGSRLGAPVPVASPIPTAAMPAADNPTEVGDKGKKDAGKTETPPAAEPAPVIIENFGFDWSKNPKIATLAKAGFFPVLPTGPGYYSLLDVATGNYRENPPKFGYPRFGIMPQAFFDTDWSYVDDPNYDPDILERLHRVHIGDNWLFATGGEFRYRWQNETHARLTAKNNVYDLTRNLIFA